MGEIAETPQPHGSVFWMGLDTYKIPMTMYADNRKIFVDRMKSAGVNSGVLILEVPEFFLSYRADNNGRSATTIFSAPVIHRIRVG